MSEQWTNWPKHWNTKPPKRAWDGKQHIALQSILSAVVLLHSFSAYNLSCEYICKPWLVFYTTSPVDLWPRQLYNLTKDEKKTCSDNWIYEPEAGYCH